MRTKRNSMIPFALVLALILVLSLFAGCAPAVPAATPISAQTPAPTVEPTPAPTPEPTFTPAPVELNVFAAASLTESLTAIAEKYKAVAPNVTLTFNFDSSGTLQTQIEQGAEADLFISAAQKQMTTLSEGGLIEDDTKKDLLINKVVLIVPEGSMLALNRFDQVAGDAVKLIALGNSDVPVGQYCEQIFTKLGIWDAVKKKASLGSNVKEVLTQVSSGAVDCGVVYATDANTASGIKVVAEAPEGSHKPVVYPGAVLKSVKNAEAAKAFLAFLSGPEASAEFEQIGFAIAK